MRPSTPLRLLGARFLSALLAWTMALGPITAAYGAPTPLADIPIAAKVSAKPNIIYTLDDSGSMQYNYLPDYVVNAAANISVSLSRQGPIAGKYRARTSSNGSITNISVGDWINVIGANQAEYNGFFQVINKPSSTTLEYEVGPVAATPITVAAGYGNIQIVTSAAYCKAGAGTTTCTQQPVAINSSGNSVITGSTISRPGPLSVGGTMTATLTNTAANLAPINDGDAITISNSTTSATLPGNSSNPYYGTFIVTKISPTQLTYQITAIANNTPINAGSNRYILFGGSSTYAAPPLHAADFNRLAYNPSVTYTAPKKSDGQPLTNTGTDARGNYAYDAVKWASASVDRDPYASYEVAAGVTPMWSTSTKDNLSIRVAVPLYCNTDWPLLENDMNWSAGPNGATALDAGDINGQYQSGKGAWCRINGTKYDLSSASGAPATAVAGVEMGYNYPWQSSNNTNGPEYFYRQLSVKTLWCDKTSPYWPRSGVIIGCVGGTFNPGSTVSQYCKVTGSSTACTGSYPTLTYKDNASPTDFCDNSATYCSPPGTGSAPECRPCTCVPNTPTTVASCYRSDTNTAGSGSCGCTGTGCSLGSCGNFTITAASCTGGTPIYQNTPANSANCTSFLWNPVTGTNTTTTLLQDAGAPAAGAGNTSGAPGTTCRHNNYTYAVGGAAGLFKYSNTAPAYPGEGAGTGLFNTAVTGGCPAVGTTVQIPRHYYVVDSVEFCSDRNVTVNAQWRGFGAGACAASNDLQHFKEVKYGKFVRVDLFPSNAVAFPGAGSFAAESTPYPNGRAWLATTSPGPNNSESINYANWYAYYSTRLLAAKTTSATAFSFLTNVPPDPIGYRVGFHNLGEEPATYGGFGTPIIWQDVNDWDQTQRDAWYGKLFGIAVNNYKTPTLDAMMRIGNLVETGTASGLPASINPLPASAADPFPTNPATGQLVSCTNNYHILFTDGKTNQVTPITTPGDQDALVPTSISAIPTVPPDYVLGYLGPLSVANAAWPRPFVQGTAVPNTLSDVAAYYWTRDLRTSLDNDVPASSSKAKLVCIDSITSPCPPAAKVPEPTVPYCAEPSTNPCPPAALVVPTIPNDLDPSKDVAWWQHVNFSAISFGAEGTLSASNQAATMAAIRAGTLNWPDLTQPNNPIYPKGAAQGAVAVDDLWHATVMSRGSFVYARSPIEVAYGLANILAGIQNQRKSRTGAAFGGQVLNAGNNVIFEPTIEPGWAGDLLKVEINPATGAEVQTWWQASQTLAAQIDPTAAGVAEPWMLPAHRRIVTSTSASGPGVPFQWANLTSAQLLSLAPDATTQKKMVSYLRGGNTWTDSVSGITYDIEGTSVGQFRKRYGALGDLSNAQPVMVAPPNRTYVDGTDPGYTAFVAAKATRPTMVVAPANDGMVHVFDAGPMPAEGPPVVPVTAGGGTELFAYIPKALFKGVAGTAAEDASGIQALTYQDGGIPIYKHHMYVDSSPRVADVDFGGPDWRTIVVGGLGKGGNSYYALDLTSASAVDETAASGKFLWEWSNPEVKYSYGRPVIVKVRDSGYPKGRWVVIVTGGYDNASGKGKVFFLDAKTGTLLSTVTTSEGAAPGTGQATGLAQIHAFVHDKSNQIAEQIYGGDLLGNVWRIDVSGTDSYLTASAVLFAQLTDPSGAPQPVTVAPQIEIDINNGIDRYVFIGTGRLLDTTDLTSPSPPQTQTMYAIRDGTLSTFSTTGLPIQPRSTLAAINPDGVSPIASGAPNGWYHDLPNETDDSERIVVDPRADVNVAAYVGTMVQSDPCIISLPAKLYARDYTTAESLILDASGNPAAYADFPEGLVDIATVGMIQADGSQIVGILGSKEIPGTKPVRLANKFIGQGSRLSWRLLGTQ